MQASLMWVPRPEAGTPPVTSGSIATIVVVPDVHLEPEVEFDPSYHAVKRFIHEVQPDAIVILGDFGEFGCFNHHDRRKTLLMEGRRYRASVDQIRGELDFMQASTKKLCYAMGNHEDWVQRYIEEHAELDGAINLAKDLELDDRGIEWCPYNAAISIGKLNFTHGWKTNSIHAKASALEFGDHIFYGHTHDHQEYTPHFRADRQPYAAVSCGCLCSKNPSYMRNKPNRWINGFVFIEVREDGNFNHHWLAITDGRFSFGEEKESSHP